MTGVFDEPLDGSSWRLCGMREIYFHEDDYCQQQLLPCEAAAHVTAELGKIDEFSEAHRVKNGLGWTDAYVRAEAPAEIKALGIRKEEFDELVSLVFPAFQVVYTGYSSERQRCKRTAAWGRSQKCALFADWNEESTITNIWTEFFNIEEESIRMAAKAIATLGTRYQLIYVDWAWGYECDALQEEVFISLLRNKLEKIEENVRKSRGPD